MPQREASTTLRWGNADLVMRAASAGSIPAIQCMPRIAYKRTAHCNRVLPRADLVWRRGWVRGTRSESHLRLTALLASSNSPACGWCARPRRFVCHLATPDKSECTEIGATDICESSARQRPNVVARMRYRRGRDHFGVEVRRGVGTLLQVPVKCSVVFGAGFVMKLDRFNGHAAASLNCACALVPKGWF